MKWGAIALVLLLAAGIGAALFMMQAPPPPKKMRPISIDSTPPGARLRINGESIGETPFYSEDLFTNEAVDVLLVKDGYKPWREQYRNTEPVTIQARLERLPAMKVELPVQEQEAPFVDPDLEAERDAGGATR